MSDIPRIIHQIWYQGKSEIPEHLFDYRKAWVKMHPGYQFVLWDQQRIESVINKLPEQIQKLYYSYELMIQRIDFAKYVILYLFGGIYIDMDVKCLASLEKIFIANKDKKVILSLCPYNFFHVMLLQLVGLRPNEKLINNGVIACVAWHPFLLAVINQAALNRHTIFKSLGKNFLNIFFTTGPVMVTHAARKFVNHPDIAILDNSYFEACDIDSVKNGCVPPPHAIGLHVYEGSWMTSLEKGVLKLFFFIRSHFISVLLAVAIAIWLFQSRKRRIKK
jgi:hypothetical protein